MRVKKLVSALSALAITVTAMAGLAVNAGAEGEAVITRYDFSESNPFTAVGRLTPGVGTGAISGTEGVGTFTTGGNSGNVVTYDYFNFSELLENAVSYTVEYDIWLSPDIRGGIAFVDSQYRPTENFVKGNYPNSDVGAVAKLYSWDGTYVRVNSDKGGRPIDQLASKAMIKAKYSVDLKKGTYTYQYTDEDGRTATSYDNNGGSGTLSAKASFERPDTLEIWISTPQKTEVANIDNLVISVTKEVEQPEPEIPEAVDATAIEGDFGSARAFMATYTLNSEYGTPVWKITAEDYGTKSVEANIPATSGEVKLGLIVDNVPDGAEISATFGYADAE